jgi:hypothetical protein
MNKNFLILMAVALLPMAQVHAVKPVPAKATPVEVDRDVLQTQTCKIVAVEMDGDSMHVEFIGRWLPAAHLQFADTDRNGFTIVRDTSYPKDAWKALAKLLHDNRNKPITLVIHSRSGLVMRSGVPVLSTVGNRLEILAPGQKVKAG